MEDPERFEEKTSQGYEIAALQQLRCSSLDESDIDLLGGCFQQFDVLYGAGGVD